MYIGFALVGRLALPLLVRDLMALQDASCKYIELMLARHSLIGKARETLFALQGEFGLFRGNLSPA